MLIDTPSPIKKPSALDVPIANFAGMLCLVKYGTNKVAPPIPTNPEIIEKMKATMLEIKLFGIVDLTRIVLWV